MCHTRWSTVLSGLPNLFIRYRLLIACIHVPQVLWMGVELKPNCYSWGFRSLRNIEGTDHTRIRSNDRMRQGVIQWEAQSSKVETGQECMACAVTLTWYSNHRWKHRHVLHPLFSYTYAFGLAPYALVYHSGCSMSLCLKVVTHATYILLLSSFSCYPWCWLTLTTPNTAHLNSLHDFVDTYQYRQFYLKLIK